MTDYEIPLCPECYKDLCHVEIYQTTDGLVCHECRNFFNDDKAIWVLESRYLATISMEYPPICPTCFDELMLTETGFFCLECKEHSSYYCGDETAVSHS